MMKREKKMNINDLTLKQVAEIKNLKNTCKTIGDWKRAMKIKAEELELTDQQILAMNRS
jgi:hypothetical protein